MAGHVITGPLHEVEDNLRVARVQARCPSCAAALARVEVGDAATVRVRRRCRRCGDRWALTVRPVQVVPHHHRIDHVDLVFVPPTRAQNRVVNEAARRAGEYG